MDPMSDAYLVMSAKKAPTKSTTPHFLTTISLRTPSSHFTSPINLNILQLFLCSISISFSDIAHIMAQ